MRSNITIPQGYPARPKNGTYQLPVSGAATAGDMTNVTTTSLDESTGAPLGVRLQVAAARGQVDKLRTLRSLGYPDATPTPDGNFTYTNPKTGKKMLFDEKGMSGRDIAEMIPGGMELGGAIAGGVGGAAMGGPLGSMAGAGGGAVLGREFADKLIRGFGVDQRTGTEKITDNLVTGGVNALGQGAGMALGKALRIGGNLAAAATRTAPNAGEAAIADAAKSLDIPMPKMLNSRSKLINWATAATRNTPFVSDFVASGANATRQGTADAAGRIQSAIAGTQATGHTPFLAGIRGASEGVIERFKVQREALDDGLQQFMDVLGPDARIPTPNAESKLAELEALVAKSPELQGPRYAPAISMLKSVLKDASGGIENIVSQVPNPVGAIDASGAPLLQDAMGQVQTRPPGVPFGVLRKVRSELGEAVNWTSPLERKKPEERLLGEVYDALREDIKNGAKLAGPDAEAALAAHDDFVHLSRSRKELGNLETYQKIAEKMGDKRPVQWALSMSAEKDGPKQVAAILDSFSKEERQGIVGSIFEDMGAGPDGAFNAEKFLKNWQSLGHVRNEIFGHSEFRNVMPQIQALAKVAETAEGAKRISDFKTSGILAIPLTGAGLWGASTYPGLAAFTGLSAGTVATLISRPNIANLVFKGMAAGSWTAQQTARLLAIGKAEPDLRDAINEFVDHIGATPNPATTQHLNGGVGTRYEPLR